MMNAPRPFSRSLGILDLEGSSLRVAVIGGAMFLLIAWGFWGFRSTVAVYAVSQDARLEVDRRSLSRRDTGRRPRGVHDPDDGAGGPGG